MNYQLSKGARSPLVPPYIVRLSCKYVPMRITNNEHKIFSRGGGSRTL